MTDAKALLAKIGGGKNKQKGLPSRTGKRKGKFIFYFGSVAPRRKLRHMLRRNGKAFAQAWAQAHGRLPEFMQMTGRG